MAKKKKERRIYNVEETENKKTTVANNKGAKDKKNLTKARNLVQEKEKLKEVEMLLKNEKTFLI